MVEILEQEEVKALEMMRRELGSHLELAREAHNLIGRSVQAVPEGYVWDLPLSQRVCVNLLIRIANDLRGATILAERGYPLQALTLAASIYEAAMQVGYIRNDEKIADDWVGHNKPDVFFKDIKDMTKEVFRKSGIPDPDAQAERDYRFYQWFCMAKHMNPLLQQHAGFQEMKGMVVAQNGPDLSEFSIRGAWFTFDYSGRFVYIALTAFVSSHVPPERQPNLAEKINSFAVKRKELNRVAIDRWGPDDPFQGKWRSHRNVAAGRIEKPPAST